MHKLQKQIDYWHKSGINDWKTAEYLLEGKRYDACLFFCHLSIEKLLKGMVVIEIHDTPPYIHDLERLAKIADISLEKEQKNALTLITSFHLAGRYKIDKLEFYKKCTKPYTEKHFKLCHKIFLWLKKEFQKKSSKE